MGSLIRARDWSATPLGPIASWPQSLRTVLSVCLQSPVLGTVLWGPDLLMLYNDASIASMDDRHPAALGCPVAKVWGETWEMVSTPFNRAMRTGEGFAQTRVELPMLRRGRPETTYWDFSAAPIRGEDGRIVGLLAQGVEITQRVLAERRAAEEVIQQHKLFQQAPGFTAILNGPEHVFTFVNEAYVTLVGRRDLVGRTVRDGLPDLEGQEFYALLDKVFATGERFVAAGVPIHLQRSSDDAEERFVDFVYEPMRDHGGGVTGIFVQGFDTTDTHRAQQALRESEEFNRRVLASSDDCIKVLDLDASIIFMSEGGQQVMEVSDFATIKDCSWPTFLKGQGRTEAEAAVAAARAGSSGRFQAPADTMAGTPKWWDVQVTPILGPDGQPEKLLAVSRDITATRLIEDDLRQARGLNTPLLESSRDCIVVLDLDGRTQWISPGGIESMEVSDVDAILGLSWLRVWKGDDNVAARAAVADARAGGTGKFEGFCPTHKATPKWWDVVIRPLPGPDGRPERLISVGRDVTKRKQAELELRSLNETLEQRVEERTRERDRAWRLSQDLLVVAGSDGSLDAINAAWTRALGWTEDELRGTSFTAYTHGEDLEGAMAAFKAIFDHPLTDPYEFRLRHKDGTYRRFAWTGAFEDGKVYANGRDVTAEHAQRQALQQAEEALRQSQKMEAVGHLTGGLAHDFNNLLAGISGSLELMQTRMGQGRLGDLERYMAVAQGAAKRAAALTHRLLAFSRRQTLDPKPTNVNRLVADMEELVRRTIGPQITLEVVGAAGLWPALIDSGQLENAMLNLCINARDAMPAGGRITIETANKWLDEVGARRHDMPPGQYLSVCVSDTGTGMAPELIAKVFEPFFTTKPIGEGTGLGLSMVYGFARQSGGQVRIYSEVGKGTTVCLYLPRHHGETDEDDVTHKLASMARAEVGETVLVVDDEPSVRMLVTEVLEDLGYTAIEAADSVAGLKVLQSDVRIDLLVTDVGLPGGMNGRQMAEAGRERRQDLRVLFITGYAENSVIGHGHLEPGMQVMTKPFAMDALAARIKDLITTR